MTGVFTTHVEESGVIYHTARTLTLPGLRHGFSTRSGGVSSGIFSSLNLGRGRGDSDENVQANYALFCTAIGVTPERCVLAKQVHRDDVKIATESDAGAGLLRAQDYEADALITDTADLTLVIFSADCIPILLYDPKTRSIGAAHAGWRGTALGIAKKTVQAMERSFGARADDIHAAIGPGISLCCFETESDVADAMRDALGTEAGPYIKREQSGKYRVDLKGINAHWLRSTGVRAGNIAVSEECTACDTSLYWSHRRMGEVRGSQVAMICLQDT